MRIITLVVACLAGCSAPGPRPVAPSAPAADAAAAETRCLPVVAPECGCVYACGVGTRDAQGDLYTVVHPFWKGVPLRARIAPWCQEGQCTPAFHAEIVCDGICPPRAADPTCHFDHGACVGATP